ncbi:hypothetical protein SteCoe_32424 [Stentor coeruleus]|uniref:RING-type domain-containing protein n=1 Tax=Stentor coeruleus TaxID=5963 RepID=A0A1R2AZ08_9CILI|nr:hypothetical protein SteCoe_32424 [Stentor coeruleus]
MEEYKEDFFKEEIQQVPSKDTSSAVILSNHETIYVNSSLKTASNPNAILNQHQSAILDRVLLFCICPLCTQKLSSPIIFSCSHTFCSSCAEGYINLYKYFKAIPSCPVCHENFSILPHSSSWLVKNRRIENLQTMTKTKICKNCSEPGNHCCLTCRIFLCKNCSENHKTEKNSYHDVNLLSSLNTSHCLVHFLKYTKFCVDDKILLCLRCFGSHRSHNLQSLDEALVSLSSLVIQSKEHLSRIVSIEPLELKDYPHIVTAYSNLLSISNPLRFLQFTYKLDAPCLYLAEQLQNIPILVYIDRGTSNVFACNHKAQKFFEAKSSETFPKWCAFTPLPNGEILITGGKGAKEFGALLNMFILSNDMKCKYTGSMIFGHSSHAAVLVDKKVYILAGKGCDNLASGHCEVFDIITKESDIIPAMKHGRTCPAAVNLSKSLYVFGGFTQSISNNIEKLTFGAKEWIDLDITLPIRLFQPGAVAIDESQIMIIGGEISSEIKNVHSMIFNATTEQFGFCKKMPIEDSWLGCWYDIKKTPTHVLTCNKRNILSFHLKLGVWEIQDIKKPTVPNKP